RHVVGVDVVPGQLRHLPAAVDRAAGDRLADAVVVLPDRLDELRLRAGPLRAEGVQPLAAVPAVVATLLDQVDLLVQVLPDVTGPEAPRLAVERHPPDVP